MFASAGAEAVELPIADGGEGTADVLHRALGGEWREAVVSDPLGRPVPARWLLLPDGRAMIEAAAAIGLPLLAPHERDPLVASSRGLGELVLAALRDSPRELLVALGGSATVDGGAGMREVLRELPVRRRSSATSARRSPTQRVCSARRRARRPRASRPSSGGSPGWTSSCPTRAYPARARRAVWARRWRRSAPSSSPGAPAVLDLVGFDDRVRDCDLAVTGEGQVDRTTAEGKAPGVVAARCAAAGVRCVVFGGRVLEEIAGVETVALSGDPARAEADLEELGRQPRS